MLQKFVHFAAMVLRVITLISSIAFKAFALKAVKSRQIVLKTT